MSKTPHKFDASNLRQTIIDSPKQFGEGLRLADGIKVDGSFKRIVFSAEGGSGFPSQLLEIIVRDYLEQSGEQTIPQMIANHDYKLPKEAFSEAINIFSSYSGNTEETISNLEEAIAAKLPAIVIASGGQVEEISREQAIPFIKLPMPYATFQPRMGTGYFVGVMSALLENHGFVKGLVDQIKASAGSIGADIDEVEDRGKQLAEKIAGKTPVVYANEKYSRLAMVWKIKFNEHAKNPAFWNFFPELNHNEMIGFSNFADRYFLVMLRDSEDDLRNLKRYTVTAEVVGEKGLESAILDLQGKNAFEKIFNSLLLADFTAYYLAEKNGIDPTPVDMVEDFKKRLTS